MKEILFLTLEDVLYIHEDQISRYGGMHGVRDLGLLESAIAQPMMQFQNQYLHKNIYDMASAYIYHLCLNHPFFDGNKRTALVTMILFLRLNDVFLNCEDEKVETLVIKIATKKISKPKIALFLRKHSLM